MVVLLVWTFSVAWYDTVVLRPAWESRVWIVHARRGRDECLLDLSRINKRLEWILSHCLKDWLSLGVFFRLYVI